jgi:glycosyltransferase involved in cell wall biosynthesis
MKIAYLAAANSIHSIRWIKFFVARGYDITWITLAPPNKDAEELIKTGGNKISFHEIRPSPLADVNGQLAILHLPLAILRTKRILKKERPDILHIHSAGTYGLVGALTGFHPTIVTPWGSDILLNTGLRERLVSYVIKYADYFTCDGENTREKLITLGASANKIELIRFGVDIEKFSPKGGSALGEEPNDPYKPVTIISLRTLIPIYDIETLIKAAKIVLKEAGNVSFVIAGDGDQKPYLQELAKELGIDAFIKFVGRYSPDTLPKMFEESDIYVSTALSDSGLSASTAEAMAAGLPTIVSDSGDNRMWIDENKGGFVFACKDEKALAQKLLELIKNSEMRASFGAYNRKIIEEKNNYYREMAKTEEIYKRLADASSQST